MTFKDLEFTSADMFGFRRARVQFPNGFGASIVIGSFSYGGSEGLYELGVLNRDGGLTYETPLTDDVLGHLTEDDVTRVLGEIEALPVAQEAIAK